MPPLASDERERERGRAREGPVHLALAAEVAEGDGGLAPRLRRLPYNRLRAYRSHLRERQQVTSPSTTGYEPFHNMTHDLSPFLSLRVSGGTPEVMSWTRPWRTEGLISRDSLVAKASSDIILSWKGGIQTPMAQGRSTKIISMIKWIRTSRLSIKNSFSLILSCQFSI